MTQTAASQPNQEPPKLKKFCQTCHADITSRGRRAYMCRPCAILKEKADKYILNLKASRDRAKRTCDTHRATGLEYEHQYHSRDGKAYIIPALNRSNYRVLKVCRSCGKGDELVHGRWGPIFSTFDARGMEVEPVLLCLACYKEACTWKTTK